MGLATCQPGQGLVASFIAPHQPNDLTAQIGFNKRSGRVAAQHHQSWRPGSTSVEGLDAASLDGILASADEAKKIIDGIKKTSKSLRDDLAADLEDAPGITVLILDLGLELAEMNKRRAKAKFAALSARREVFEESLVHADIAAQFVRIAQSKITSDDFDRTLRLEIEIDRESMIARDDVTIATDAVFFKLLVLRLYVSATWLVEYQKAVLPVRLGQIAHSESIAESRVNDEAWQAMIKSGIDALVEYHKGGLKKEDLANFLRLAQTVALFFIAE